MKNERPWLTTVIFDRVLDENNPPVARMRLLSPGVRTNNRAALYEAVSGDKGCLACGNCVDACPVVRDRRRFVFLQNQRTSMALENVVGNECRRCFGCVGACPQVGKSVKEYVSGFRRAEKVAHACMATLMIFLPATGIFLYHYGDVVPAWHYGLLRVLHIIAGLLLVFVPLLYFRLDPKHMKRAYKHAFQFGEQDKVWLQQFWAYLKKPSRTPLPFWGEFNTYHKFWYVYLTFVVPILVVSGLFSAFGGSGPGVSTSNIALWIHAAFALPTDLLVILHIYLKLIRFIFSNTADMIRSIRKQGDLHYPFLYDTKA